MVRIIQPTVLSVVANLVILAGSAVLMFGQDSDLKVLTKPQPPYTDLARQNYVIGIVLLRVLFKSDGKIGTIDVVRALPYGLTEQAIAAARRMRFEPKVVNGHPVNLLKPVEYRFDIYTDEDDKDLKSKAKILTKPIFDTLTRAERNELRKRKTVVEVHLGGDGVVKVDSITPDVDDETRAKIEAAIQKIKFKPAQLKGNRPISTTKTLKIE